MLVDFVAHLHSTCGPLAMEATEGSSQVLARTAAQLAMQVGRHKAHDGVGWCVR